MGWCDPWPRRPLSQEELPGSVFWLAESGSGGSPDRLARDPADGRTSSWTRLHVRYDATSFPRISSSRGRPPTAQLPDATSCGIRGRVRRRVRGGRAAIARASGPREREAGNLSSLTGWPSRTFGGRSVPSRGQTRSRTCGRGSSRLGRRSYYLPLSFSPRRAGRPRVVGDETKPGLRDPRAVRLQKDSCQIGST